MRSILLFFIFLSTITISSQELNCQVTVNFDQVSGSNRQVFKTLETSITEFVNKNNGQIKLSNLKNVLIVL